MRARAVALSVLLWLLSVSLAHAQSLPSAKPEEVGLSSDRLNRAFAAVKADVDKGALPGAVLLVARHGKVVMFDAVGMLDPATKVPMTKDAIFRIYSMSKPTTFWIDPKEDMFVVFMIQDPKQGRHYRALLKDMIYAAVDKPAAK